MDEAKAKHVPGPGKLAYHLAVAIHALERASEDADRAQLWDIGSAIVTARDAARQAKVIALDHINQYVSERYKP